MAAKLYFYAKNGTEISDSPLNGIDHTGSGSGLSATGASLDHDSNAPLWHDSKGRIARHTVYGRQGLRNKEKVVTIADFPGHRHVLVKAWYPKEAQCWTEWFWLVPKPTNA